MGNEDLPPYRCPACGNHQSLEVCVSVYRRLEQYKEDGEWTFQTDYSKVNGDECWEDDDAMVCGAMSCGFAGTVKDFSTEKPEETAETP